MSTAEQRFPRPRFPRMRIKPGTRGVLQNKKVIKCSCCGSCCIGVVVCLAVIVALSLIPVYTKPSTHQVDINGTNFTLVVAYTSNATDGRFLFLTDLTLLSQQIAERSSLEGENIRLESATFYAHVQSQVISACERTADFTGDVFVAEYVIEYPTYCIGMRCRQRFINQIEDALRMNYQVVTVQMLFTTREEKSVQLLFCGFFSFDSNTNPSSDCTTETRNSIYLLDIDMNLYQFDPINYGISRIVEFNCTESFIISMAVQRNGSLWLFVSDRTIYQYNLRTTECQLIVNASEQVLNSGFGFHGTTFLKSASSDQESLYTIEDSGVNVTLMIFNWNTYTFTVVNTLRDANSSIYDLAGTPTGRLFGLNRDGFSSGSTRLVEIDSTNAQILSEYSLGNTDATNGGTTVYYDTLASYQNNFFLFSSDLINSSIVYVFNSSSSTSSQVQTLPNYIYKATSSSCLGT